jgi:hypothetical protein
MYTLDSTHCLRTSAHTADQAVGILGQHLTDCWRDGPIDWLIVTPGGRKLSGSIDVVPATDTRDARAFIAEELERIRADLTAHPATTVWAGR